MANVHRLIRLRRRLNARRRRQRVVLERNDFENMSETDIFARYRFTRATLTYLITLLSPSLSRLTRRSHALNPGTQVLACLRFFATGAFFQLIGDSMGISKSAVSRSVTAVSIALANMARQFIHFPVGHVADRTKADFYKLAGFPNVVSAVDGTFIRIQAPSNDEADFVNRKGFHAINVQMSSDAHFKITNIVANWPGSVHDARIFRGSQLCQNLNNGTYDGFLLGDSAYPCTDYLLTPFANTPTASHTAYNNALCRSRVVVEQMFGILKRRFGCLHSGLRVSPIKASIITTACAVLHNIGIIRNDILPVYPENQQIEIDHLPATDNAHGAMRNYIRESYFN